MKTKLSRKFLAMFFTLCMVLSFVPIPTFAAELDFLPQGVTYSKDNKHTYHTQVNVTANVSVKDSTGTVIETTEVSKSSEDFLEGGVGTLQGKLENLQTEIETPYKTRGTVTRDDGTGQTILDHFETETFYKFTPTSGDTIDFIIDLEKAKQYFNEHSDATGTFTETYDSHQYQKYNYTYDLNVQKNSQSTSTITEANVENVKFDYQHGDAPQATAQVTAADADKYEISYECWQQFENNNPVAAWYSDNGSHGSLPTITEFEGGKSYVYSIMLKPKDGYSFSSETVITVNGQKVVAPFVGGSMYIPSIKTITPSKQSNTITTINIDNVKLDYQPGSAPQATAKRSGVDQDKYDIIYECWQKKEKGSDDTMTTVAYWYSDEQYYSDSDKHISNFEKGRRYKYSVKLKAKDGYTFDSNLSNKNVTLNGANLPSGTFVNVLDDGKTCLITYGTEMCPGQAIEKIQFDGVTINFNIGDKPRFNGSVDPYIYIDHQRWDANDGSGYGITSSDFWNERYNGKLITEFESGKSYTYGVYFKISDLGMEKGYRFDQNTKLYINGQNITLAPDQISLDDNGETIWLSNVLTMTPKSPGSSSTTPDYSYKVIEGANSSWVNGVDDVLIFRVDGDLSKFMGIKVDDKWVDEEDYTAVSGSTVITLKNEYLKTLSEGQHNITFVYKDGKVSSSFEIKESIKSVENSDNNEAKNFEEDSNISKSDNPKTGDNSNILAYTFLFTASVLEMFGIIIYNNKKKKSIV